MPEIMDLLIPEAEKYVDFYSDLEIEKMDNIIQVFSIYNAESTAVGKLAANTKTPSKVLNTYRKDIKKRFIKEEQEEIEDLDHIESQFEGLNVK